MRHKKTVKQQKAHPLLKPGSVIAGVSEMRVLSAKTHIKNFLE